MIILNVVITYLDTSSGQTDEYDSASELGSTSLSSSVEEIMCTRLASGSNSSN